MNNRKTGIFLSLTYTLFLLYYIIWTVIIPLVDEGHVLKEYFPDHYYAQSVPILFAFTVFSFTFAYIGIILIRTATTDTKQKHE